MRRVEQAIYLFFISLGRFVLEKSVDFSEGWGQTREVKRQAAQQDFFGGLRGRLKFFLLQFLYDKIVDGIFDPICLFDLGYLCFFGRNESPVWLVLRPIFDPFDQGGFFPIAQTEVRCGGGHQVFGISRNDAVEDFAAAQTALGYGHFAGVFFQPGVSCLGDIEAQSSFLFGFIRAVAGKTFVGQNGLDMQVVIQLGGQRLELCLQIWWQFG